MPIVKCVGILTRLLAPGAVVQAAEATAAILAASSPDVEAAHIPYASPWAPEPCHLSQFVYPDLYGSAARRPLTRAAAMAVPSIARGRHLICSALGKSPLVDFTDETPAAQQPAWLYRTDTTIPPYHRMVWTVDDLIFHGWSLWVARRGAGQIIAADRVAYERWDFDPDGRVLVDGELVESDGVILIPGPHEGILHFAADRIREAAALEDNAARAAANPAAHIDLHYTGDQPLSESQIAALTARWAAARRGENGGVAYTSKHVEARELGSAAEHLLVEGRNAASVNMARIISIPASMIDATNAGASLTYETSAGRNAEFLDYGASLYADAIAARLSLDDVVPRGHTVRFDTSGLRDAVPDPTGPHTLD